MPLVDITTDERKRFESFKLGGQAPAQTVGGRHGHARSHSRNSSISASLSGFSFPTAPLKPTLYDMPAPKPARPLSMPPMSMALPNAVPTLVVNPKRNSHHRRRSSVSTRHESAELMGVSLPELPPSTSDDNVNLGEKDSIRRRALWALEGKQDVAFSKVEIPDMHTPDIEKMMFDFSTKPSLASNPSPSFGNVMGNKRDSFKLLGPSSSSKDQLGTLLEEEEEEEEEEETQEQSPCVVEEPKKAEDSLPSPAPSVQETLPSVDDEPITPTPAVAVTQPTPAKSRPANLNLRPLSLTPENLITATSGLPTPTLTPSPRSGLRSLSLSPSPVPSDDDANSIKQSRRSSAFFAVSPTPGAQRPTLNLTTSPIDSQFAPSSEDDPKPSRRSSISYKRSSSSGSAFGSCGVTVNAAGLPTPEMTPTYARRYSTASDSGLSSAAGFNNIEDEQAQLQSFQFFRAPQSQTEEQTQARPLSASEQHFLFKSHNALLARITDLERALTMRKRESWSNSSRPVSMISSRLSFTSETDAQSDISGGPSDEMLRLVADLKAERDELKRDVDGWRQRVANLENQTAVLGKRVESERREAWVARSRVGLLEVEKQGLERAMSSVEEKLRSMEREMETVSTHWVQERERLTKDNLVLQRRVEDLEAELERTKIELEEAKKSSLELDPLATPTPNRSFENIGLGFGMASPLRVTVNSAPFGKKHGLGFMSVDSEASTTDVEPDSASDDGAQSAYYSMKTLREESIAEEDGEVGYCSEEDEEEYDDEEEDDNGLAGYEDEDEETDNVSLGTSSSFGSEQEMEQTAVHLSQTRMESPTTPKPASVFQRPTHAKRASLSRTWTFPKSVPAPLTLKDDDDSVDHFFGCLEDDSARPSASDANSMPSSPSAYSYEKTKGLFAKAAKEVIDDNASFFLPFGEGFAGDEVCSLGSSVSHERNLSLIDEEEEAEEEEVEQHLSDFEDEGANDNVFGGIKITFTPPQEDRFEEESKEYEDSPTTQKTSGKRVSPPPMLPALDLGFGDLSFDENEEEEEEGDIFNFGRPLVFENAKPTLVETRPLIEEIKAIVSSSRSTNTTASSIPRSIPVIRPISPSTSTSTTSRTASPSSIPRSVSRSSRSSTSTLSIDSNASSPSESPVPQPMPLSWSPAKSTIPLKAVSSSARPLQSCMTPQKRGGVATSFIRQPSPSRTTHQASMTTQPLSVASKQKAPVVVPTSTFIRQPSRKPLLPSGNTNGSTMIPQPAPILSEETNVNSSSYRFSDERISEVTYGFEDNYGKSAKKMTLNNSNIDFGFDDDCYDPNSSQHPHTQPFNTSSPLRSSSRSSVRPQYMSLTACAVSSQTPNSTSVHPPVPSPPSTAPLFQSLTNFMWGSKPKVPASAPTVCVQKKGGFVAREKQLRKLQLRMEVEGVVAMKSCVQVHCKKCIHGEIVYL